jgi:hypothetical protein
MNLKAIRVLLSNSNPFNIEVKRVVGSLKEWNGR